MEKKYIALTFDDGPSNVTNEILDILESNGIPGTFFLIGENIENFSDASLIMNRQIAMGCELCNHSYTHSDMTTLDADVIVKEISDTTGLIKSIAGKTPAFFRPPFISVNDTMHDVIDLPFICGLDSKDWDGNTTSDDRISNILSGVEDGTIILMHDFTDNSKTVAALPRVVSELKSRGYEFVTLSKLFEIKGVNPDKRGFIWSVVK